MASGTEPAFERERIGFITLLALVAAIGGFLFGFDSGVINGTVEALAAAFGSGAASTGFAVASVLLGCAVGALAAGTVADRLGRRPVMFVTGVVFFISALGSGIARGVWEFNFYRIFGGLAVGAASVVAPAYIAEIAPARLRGRLGSLQQLAIVVGLFSAFLSNYLIARAAGGAGAPFWFDYQAWRWMFWVEVLPAAVFCLGSVLIPESPRYLVARGFVEQAAAVFSRIASEEPRTLVAEVQRSLDSTHAPRAKDLFNPGTLRLRAVVWVGVTLSAFQQLVGINVIFYYGAVLWQAAGATEEQALVVNVVTGGVNILFTLVAMRFIDTQGRKPLLLIGSAVMAVALGVMALAFSSGSLDATGSLALGRVAALAALAAANLYIAAFAVSWGPVVWVMLGEMFPNQFRGAALSIAASAQWLANFLVTVTFPLLLKHLGLPGAYGLYALMAALSFLFVSRWVRETKGLRLEEM